MIGLQLGEAPGGSARRSREEGLRGFGAGVARHTGFTVLVLAAGLLAGCGGGGKDKTVSTPPTVTSTVPASGSTSALNTAAVSATFERAMDAASLTAGTFTLACPAGTPVAGAVAYDAASRKATLTPTAMLPADTSCTATLTTGVKDSMGVALANAFTWSFSTTVDPAVVASGMQIFRYDTFGDETQWTDALHMNDVISAAVDPTTALTVGLKVDAEAPASRTAASA